MYVLQCACSTLEGGTNVVSQTSRYFPPWSLSGGTLWRSDLLLAI